MTSPPDQVAADRDSQPFSSLAELKLEHSTLLKARRDGGETADILAAGEDFIARGRATGAGLDGETERAAAQSLLDYWSTLLYRAGREPPDATLVDFDPTLAPELDDRKCPYVGLDAFREPNQGVFFGRERLIEEWLARLRSSRFLAVVGSSGSGKSSLVLGGLLPKLKAGAIHGSEHWHFDPPFVPGSAPLAPLARLMHTTADAFRQNPRHLRELADASPQPHVLVVDQFEELFTITTSETDRTAFVDNLLSLVRPPDVRHTVIVTMRSDFESHVARLPELQDLFERESVRVTPLNAAELREAINKPADLAGLKFQDGIVDELLQQILGEPVGLPLLQYTLLKLWENRTRNRVTWDAYRRLGGAREALARSADDLYNSLIPEDQVVAKRILLRLVRPGEGLDVTSNRVRRSTLFVAGEDPAAIDRVLDRLIRAHLLRTEGETPADQQVEVAHEALVRNWPRLVDWLEEERVNLRRRLHLTAAAQQWETSDRDAGALWAGVLLDEAGRYDDLNSLESEFVQASRAAVEAAAREEAARLRELSQAQELAEEQRRRSEAESMRAEMERQRAEERSRAAGRLRQYLRIAAICSAAALVAMVFAVFQLVAAQGARDQAQGQTAVAIQARDEANFARGEANRSRDESQQARDALAQMNQSLEQALSTQNQLRAAALTASTDFSVLGLLVATHVYRDNPSAETRGALLSVIERAPYLTTFLRGHPKRVTSVAVSPDGKTVASASSDMTIILWDLASREPRTPPLSGHTATVQSVAFSPDGKWLASGSSDGTVLVWDAVTGRRIGNPLAEHTDTVWSVAFSPDSRLLASASSDKTVRIWDVSSGRLVGLPLTGHTGKVYAVAFSPDGKQLASAGGDETVRLWDVNTGSPVGTPLVGHTDTVLSVAFNPRDGTLASAGFDSSIIFWNAASREQITDLQSPTGSVSSLAFSPDGTTLASAGTDTSVLLWNVARGQQIATLKGHGAGVASVAYAPDGRTLISGSYDDSVGVWEPGIGQRVGTIVGRSVRGILSVAASPDGKLVAAGARDGSITLSDATTGKAVGPSFAGTTDPVSSLVFSPDGKTLATASGDASTLWDVSTGLPVGAPLTDQHQLVESVAFSPDGKLLAAGGSDSIVVWDVAARTAVATLGKTEQIGSTRSVAFSPDGTLLASGADDSTISLWDMTTYGRVEPVLVTADSVNSVAFSPDGKTLASGGRDAVVHMWDVRTHQQVTNPMLGHSLAVTSVAFSRDGKTLASASRDRTIILWDAASGQHIGPALAGHTDWINSLVFDSAETLYSGGDDGIVVSWALGRDAWTKLACDIASRDLTQAEWSQVFGKAQYARTCASSNVNWWAIDGVIKDAEANLAAGDRLAAESAYALEVGFATTTSNWSLNNSLCWFGSLDGLASTVISTCNRAVEVAPDSERPNYMDSRGVARVLLGDFAGAISDFQAYVDWSQGQSSDIRSYGNERRAWIVELQAGRDPFADRSVLQRLRNE